MKNLKDNYLLNLLVEDITKKSKEFIDKISEESKNFNVSDFLKSHTKKEETKAPETKEESKFKGVTKTATVAGTYSLLIEAPGIPKHLIDINHADGQLTIEGKFGSRVIAHDIHIGNDEIQSVSLKLGILEIVIEEVKEKPKKTKIKID